MTAVQMLLVLIQNAHNLNVELRFVSRLYRGLNNSQSVPNKS